MTELAIMRWLDEGDEFYFVSDDGERFYEVDPRPTSSEQLEHLRPLGLEHDKNYPEGSLHRISFARRWLSLENSRPDRQVEFIDLP